MSIHGLPGTHWEPHSPGESPLNVTQAPSAARQRTAFVEHPASTGLPGWREAGAGRPLLLLHGWSVSGEAFGAQAALAGHGWRLIAPDHAGHGLSAARRGPATIASLADDTAALIRHLGLQDVTVVGWSMGAMVAWQLMHASPDLPLAAVGAIDMTPRLTTGPDWPHGLHGRYDDAQASQMAARVRQDWSGLSTAVAAGLWAAGAPADAEQAARVSRMMARCDPPTLASLWEDMARQDFRPALRAARVPLFHLYGERSRLYAPAVGQATLALQPTAGFASIAGAGHSPHVEHPGAFNAALLRMLDAATQRSGQ